MATIVNDRIRITVFTGRLEIFVGRGDTYMFHTVQEAVNRPIKFTFVDQDGNALSLDSATCTMVNVNDGSRVFDQQAMASVSGGNAQYNWGANDLDDKGLFEMEILLTIGGVEYAIDEKVLINVREKLST